jgi:facilitated trehalose transporter
VASPVICATHILTVVNFGFSSPACMFGALVFLPESPVWLKTKHQHEKAAASAKWLHLSGFEMAEARQMDKLPNAAPTTADDQKLFSKKIFFSRAIMLPLGIGVALLTFQQFSGIDAIIFFTVEIFRNAGKNQTARNE